ncbi:type I-MYXAN CRISPR-associated protein Cas6/Cmx6 [Nostoc sp. MBR 210]|nr:type I-MYXAN CRISPR-associated protein Cas6/Cmx6 [Nostoc sp. MBR 210]
MNFLEIQFNLRGKTLPSDQGYSIYSAVKKTVLNEKPLPPEILLCSVSGVPAKDGMIYLNRSSKLRLRCPAEQVQQWYRLLQNTVLDVQGHLVRLIQPRLCLLQASATLKARLVTFKLDTINHQELPFYFLESCNKALEKLEIKAQVFIDSNPNGDLARRALQIKGKHIVGFGVVIEGLNEQDSIKLQCYGMGGRKHFGCGWFYPAREISDAS